MTMQGNGKTYPCFACEKPMPLAEPCEYTYWCTDCDIRMVVSPEPYVSQSRIVSGYYADFFGAVTFLDHGSGYHPTP